MSASESLSQDVDVFSADFLECVAGDELARTGSTWSDYPTLGDLLITSSGSPLDDGVPMACGAASMSCDPMDGSSEDAFAVAGQELLTFDNSLGDPFPGRPSTPAATAGMAVNVEGATSSGGAAAGPSSPVSSGKSGKGKSGSGEWQAGRATSAPMNTSKSVKESHAERNRQAQRRYRQRQRVRCGPLVPVVLQVCGVRKLMKPCKALPQAQWPGH